MSESEYPELVIERQADDRGRVNLGVDYANTTVKVMVLETTSGSN